MRSLRIAALGALLACSLAVSGCTTLDALFSKPSASQAVTQATTVYQAQAAFTAAAQLEVVWLETGKATKEQAAVAKRLRSVAYEQVVAARDAEAKGDNAAAAVALKLFNQALAAFQGYVRTNNGGGP